MQPQVFKPRAYQGPSIDHIISQPRGSLWARMGMGKSVSALTAVDIMQLSGDLRGPVLILGPKRVAKNVWPTEVRKWRHLQHLDVAVAIGTEAERVKALRRDVPIVTMNYDNLPWLVAQFKGKPWPFEMVIADESTRLKGLRLTQGTERARAIAPYAHTKIKRWLNLTGTPSPNGLKDLWGQNWFVDGGERLGRSYDAFLKRWFLVVRGENRTIVMPKEFAQRQVQQALADVTLALDPKDYFDLQDPVVVDIKVDLPPAARKLYRDMEKAMFLEIAGLEVEAFNAGAKTVKCLQIASGAIYTDEHGAFEEIHDAKLEALDDIIEEAAGMPVLVAYQWKSDLARLQKAFKNGRVLDDKQSTEDAWNAGEIPVLFAHPASAGHGLNLQDGGNIIVFFGLWWDLELCLQIIERIGPMRQLQSGYDRNVFVYRIIATDTVDEQVIERIETKGSIQDILLNAMKGKK